MKRKKKMLENVNISIYQMNFKQYDFEVNQL